MCTLQVSATFSPWVKTRLPWAKTRRGGDDGNEAKKRSLVYGYVSVVYAGVCAPFLSAGSLWDKHIHAWVATFHFDQERGIGFVKFWETTTGLVYVLKNRFAQPGVLEA